MTQRYYRVMWLLGDTENSSGSVQVWQDLFRLDGQALKAHVLGVFRGVGQCTLEDRTLAARTNGARALFLIANGVETDRLEEVGQIGRGRAPPTC